MKAQKTNFKKLTFLGFTTIITIGVFYLGVWQTSRHFEKKALIENYQSQIQKPIRTITNLDENDPISDRFQIFNVRAKFSKDSEIFLGPKQIGKTVGYNIIGLFETENNQHFVLNLGFIPLDDKETLSINTEFQDLTILQHKFRGRRSIFIPENQPNSKFWFYLDHKSLAAHYNSEIAPVYFHLLSDNYAPMIKQFDKNEANFFNGHAKYAVTWFLLAFSLFVLAIIYMRVEGIKPFNKK
jgi:cytochrome oxidase assembly protein ShyY1